MVTWLAVTVIVGKVALEEVEPTADDITLEAATLPVVDAAEEVTAAATES